MQASDDGHEITGPMVDGVARIAVEGNPHLRFRRRKAEFRWHHADDLAADAFQFDGAADDGWIAGEALLPESITQDDVIVLACLVITGIEGMTQLGANAQNGEKFRGDEHAREAERVTAPCEIEFVAFKVGSGVK